MIRSGRTGHDPQEILRYTANQRTNHWLVAILFFMAGLSGLALFHPALFWLSNLFGGGPGRASCTPSWAC
jgi:cytochrome b subunit of formate dehydrogenase